MSGTARKFETMMLFHPEPVNKSPEKELWHEFMAYSVQLTIVGPFATKTHPQIFIGSYVTYARYIIGRVCNTCANRARF